MEKNTSETLYSLKFAERVRSVELGPGSRRAELGSWSSQEHLEVLHGRGEDGERLLWGEGRLVLSKGRGRQAGVVRREAVRRWGRPELSGAFVFLRQGLTR